jgi:hypothetical protein
MVLKENGLRVAIWIALGAACVIALMLPAMAYSAPRGAGRVESVVPITVEDGQVIVEVTINGSPHIPMILDTGAEDTLTEQAAAILGLDTYGGDVVRASSGGTVRTGRTQIYSLKIGGFSLSHQIFRVASLPSYITDRGTKTPVAGFIGYELFAQFAVRLDYSNRTIALRREKGISHRKNSSRLALLMLGNVPAVRARADGVWGIFAIDTGSGGALTLRREFVEGYSFDKRHPAQLRVKSGAADGIYDSIVTRIDNFDIGNSRVLRPVARYPASAAAGWPPFAESDGSIGYEILQQFAVTFDYRRREVLLERSNMFGRKAVQGTTGFQAVKVGSEGFSVVTVLDDSPAAVAGMDVGDLITEIDGVPTGAMSRADFTVPFRRPEGTVALLSVSRGGSRQKVALTLKELLP